MKKLKILSNKKKIQEIKIPSSETVSFQDFQDD